MECPNCPGVELEHFHNVYASPTARTRRAECPRCKVTQVEVVFVLGEVRGRGTGAHAIANKIGEGKLIPTLLEAEEVEDAGKAQRVRRGLRPPAGR